ncbi:hypothetical protein DYU05_15985 [Mucilaginibacter terrenus]|uniref:Uncharacterized protein n=1 Tax=Mucilaginibacter terrenus TaxID=2482727 RepID=A0A3E2NMK0_9SPHI|nr:hypothetical protein [Mucilaginibacter terrenus]RFZ82120.1 hypothetical protein DYU05_15985 [Mucilaginibacter terrenus]
MAPIFFTVGAELPIMIIPNTDAHLDGHAVLTYTYNIYRDYGFEDAAMIQLKEKELMLDKKKNPNYMGYITFEDPGKLFTYTADGSEELDSEEVQEIIENISHYRDHPGMWQI